MFVNRTEELAKLDAWWRKGPARLAVVWGRRRVGKTALVRRFAVDKRAVFHTGAGRAERAELTILARQVAALGPVSGTRDLASRPYVDWDDALDHLADVASEEPLLVVLDEFPELTATTPALANLLRAFLDRAEGRTQLRLLLCGSAVRYMQALGEERQPLYGRAELLMPLHPFRPWEAAIMLADLAPAERAAVYGIVGGVPLYLSWWDTGGSIEDNLLALACEPAARLLTEGDLVLATEAEAGEFPAAVLHAIATGRTRHNDIKDAITADPTRTLDRLVALRLVERVQPVTEPARSRRRTYRIADNFLAFHLGLLSRFRAEIDAGLGRVILPVLTALLDLHQGGTWEATFRTQLLRLAAAGELGGVIAVGPWWSADSQTEIDAVGLAGPSRSPVLVGEAKWAREVDGRRIGRDLLRKAERVPAMVDEPQLVLAGRNRVRDAPPDSVIITADDIFA